MKPKKKPKKRPMTLKQMVETATAAGAKIRFGFTERDMPETLPDDHPNVIALVVESRRITARAAAWSNCDKPNPVAADWAYRQGWAYALAAAWLRCYLKGELKVKPKP